MTTVKTVATNYSADQVLAITSAYKAGASLEDIALSVGKTVPSVRAKLSSLKVYVAKTAKPASDNKATKINKDGLKTYLESLLGKDLLNVEAASKEALIIMINAIKSRDDKIASLIADMLGDNDEASDEASESESDEASDEASDSSDEASDSSDV